MNGEPQRNVTLGKKENWKLISFAESLKRSGFCTDGMQNDIFYFEHAVFKIICFECSCVRLCAFEAAESVEISRSVCTATRLSKTECIVAVSES